MGPYDILMVMVLLAATVLGAWKGVVWQIASLGSIVVSYLVAYLFRQPVAEILPLESPWNMFVAMLGLYLIVSLVIWLGFRFVSDFIDRVRLKEFDRQVGAMFGFVKGGLLCILITLFAVTLSKEDWRNQIVGSHSGYYIAVVLDRAHAVMPNEVHDVLEPYLHSLDDRLDNPVHAHDEDEPGDAEQKQIEDDVQRYFEMGRRAADMQR